MYTNTNSISHTENLLFQNDLIVPKYLLTIIFRMHVYKYFFKIDSKNIRTKPRPASSKSKESIISIFSPNEDINLAQVITIKTLRNPKNPVKNGLKYFSFT